jgi:hypothetical protein
VLLLTLSACKDKCDDVTCINDGICVDGSCHCPEGFSGETCDLEDPCRTLNCLNDGTCDNGTCDCPDGYVGVNCENTVATKFLGTYDIVCNGTVDIDGTDKDFVNAPGTAKIYQGEKEDEIIIYTELDEVTSAIPMTIEATAEVDEYEYDLDATPVAINVSVGISISYNFLVTGSGELNENELTSIITFSGDLTGTINCAGVKQ